MVKIQENQCLEKQTEIKIEEVVSEKPKKQVDLPQKRSYKKSTQPKSSKSGHWNEEQRLKYIIFLEYHSKKFENKELRRAWKIYKAMADFIVTRNADQCRSHHQKMEKKYDNFRDIIYNHKIMIRPDVYESTYIFYAENILDHLQNSTLPYNMKLFKTEQSINTYEFLIKSHQEATNLYNPGQVKTGFMIPNLMLAQEFNNYAQQDLNNNILLFNNIYKMHLQNWIKSEYNGNTQGNNHNDLNKKDFIPTDEPKQQQN